MAGRVYLDWNATAPLRAEARDAMVAAMDLAGNPSSIHAEGRAARGAVERARAQVAAAAGANGSDVVFVSGATEAAAMVCAGRELSCGAIEHPAVLAWCRAVLDVSSSGGVSVPEPAGAALQAANSETGIVQVLPEGLAVCDATQVFGKRPFAFDWSGVEAAFVSAHKIGGPKGIGALLLRRGREIEARMRGGGQEMGRRGGTENVAAMAGFGAAAEAAARDLADGRWDRVAALRDDLERTLTSGAEAPILIGEGVERLPNTTCLVAPGWKGETQVMQLDLAGFAVSAGSACSSGKLRGGGALPAMGMNPTEAGSAIRISIGPETREEDVARFAECWLRLYGRYRARAA